MRFHKLSILIIGISAAVCALMLGMISQWPPEDSRYSLCSDLAMVMLPSYYPDNPLLMDARVVEMKRAEMARLGK